MDRFASTHSPSSAGILKAARWRSCFPELTKLRRELSKDFLDSYRPELHYMRGPGPRWREKHAPAALRAGGTQASSLDEMNFDMRTRYLLPAPSPGPHAAGLPPRGRPHLSLCTTTKTIAEHRKPKRGR